VNRLVLLAAAGLGAGLWLRTRSSSPPGDSAHPGAPAPLYPGVPYLFVVGVRQDPSDALATLEDKGAAAIEFSGASVSFRATPEGRSTVTLGQDFYGIGPIEALVRMDGQPLTRAPALV